MFQIPNLLSAKKLKKFCDYYRCLLFDKEITKIENKIGFTGVHLQNCNSKSEFFGEGHFYKSGGGGGILPKRQKKYNISSE